MEQLGDYTIERELARGGMGVVYVAHDSTGRRVALKLLLERSEPRERVRFQREAEAIGRIDHPGVVKVHSLGVDARGRDYLVLGLIEGESLAERLQRSGPLPPRAAAALARALADALAATHAKGVLHRDVKPSNVLLRAEDDAPVLTDFGLARVTNQSQQLTETGTMHGTPAYMPPEQAQGELDRIGPPSDVYGLGALLFHALTGRAPFVGSNPMALLMALFTKPAPPPSSLRAEIPPALDAIVARCLEKVPASRYPTAEALRDALDAYLTGGAKQPTRRRAIPVLLVTAGLLLTGSLLGFLSCRDAPSPSSPSSPTPAPAPEAPVASKPAQPSADGPLRRTHLNFKGLPAEGVGVRYLPQGGLLTWGHHEADEEITTSVRWGPLEGAWTSQWTFTGELVGQVAVSPLGVALLLHARRVVWLSGPTQAATVLIRPDAANLLTALAFWPEGSLLAVGVNPADPNQRAADGTRIDLYRWDGKRLEFQRALPGHQNAVQGLAFNVDGLLASCSGDGQRTPTGLLLLHDPQGHEVARIPTESLIRTAAIDRNHLALGDTLHRIRVSTAPWTASSFRTLRSPHAQKEPIFKHAVSASGSMHQLALRGDRLFAMTHADDEARKNELLLWDLDEPNQTRGGISDFLNLESFDVSPDGQQLVLGLAQHEAGKNVEVWPVGRLATKLRPRADFVRGR